MAGEIGKMLFGEQSPGGGGPAKRVSTAEGFAMLGPPMNVKKKRAS